MQVVVVIRDRLIQRGQWHIDQQVMMPGILHGHPCRRDAEIPCAEPDLDVSTVDGRSIERPADIYVRIARRRRARCCWRARRWRRGGWRGRWLAPGSLR